jgi:predicted Zn-dependent peptidase
MRRILIAYVLAGCALAQIQMPPFQKTVLPNGTTLLLLPKKDLPLIGVRVAVRGGSEADGPAAGLATITAQALLRGTKTKSREQLAQAMDQLGMESRVQVTRNAAALGVEFLAKDVGPAMGLLEEILLQPAFDLKDTQALLSQRLDGVKAIKDRPQQAIDGYYRRFYYGREHPYAATAQGDEVSLSKIQPTDVAAFYKRNYVGKNLVVVISGDFDTVAMTARAKELFGKFAAGEAYVWKKPAAPAAKDSRLLLVDSPGAAQTYFIIGQPGVERGHRDRTALELVNTLFGGRFTSMLNDALRVDSGLTYGAGSTVEEDRLPGSIYIRTFTKTESTEAAIDLALKQIDKLREAGVNAEQLASAKAYVKGAYPTERLEATDQLAAVLTDLEVFGLNRGEVDDFISRIDAVTPERATSVARQYYGRDGLVFVLVGDAAKIRKMAGKYAKNVEEVKISAPGY